MQNKSLVTIIIGTRPEAIKLAPVILAFQSKNFFKTRVLLTGQHSFMVKQVIDLFKIKIDKDLKLMVPKQTLSHLTIKTLEGLEKDFQDFKPDLILVQGDTSTAFSAASTPSSTRSRP